MMQKMRVIKSYLNRVRRGVSRKSLSVAAVVTLSGFVAAEVWNLARPETFIERVGTVILCCGVFYFLVVLGVEMLMLMGEIE